MKHLLIALTVLMAANAQADISQTSFICNDKTNSNIEVRIDLKSGHASVYDLLGNKVTEDFGRFKSYCRGKNRGLADCSHELPKEGTSLKGYMRVYKHDGEYTKYYDLIIQRKRYHGNCS